MERVAKKWVIIECPSNLGLSQFDERREPGVRKLPDWLKQNGLHKELCPEKIIKIASPSYSMDIDRLTEVRNADKLVDYALKQCREIGSELNNGSFLILLGGDCSVLIGVGLALKRKGNFALFYLDGHTDYMKPEQSQTHGAAGMALAIATGFGHSKLTNVNNLEPYFDPKNVFCVGNREYDEDYEKPIKDSVIKYIPLNKLRKKGIENIIEQFESLVSSDKIDGFLIHLDVDVLNDGIMPAVDSRQNEGLSYQELKSLLIPLMKNKKATGIEITILDPDLDPKGMYTRPFVSTLIEIFNAVKIS